MIEEFTFVRRREIGFWEVFELNPWRVYFDSRRKRILGLSLAISALICCPAWCVTKPNIVFIYADDMGWGDLGANGATTDAVTPNLDALASSGARFTSGYVTTPQCAPSRAGLMTGIYEQRFGFGLNTEGPLPLDQITIAERLRDQGYATGMVGKWHLNPESVHSDWINENLNGDWSTVTQEHIDPYRTYNRGFEDVFEGQYLNVRANFDLAGNTLAGPTDLSFPGDYRIELQTQAGLTFLDRHAGEQEPFFLYMSYFSPHTPLEAPQEYLDRFPGEMPERRRYALAMNSAMDDGVGQIMGKLAQHGLTDDTLVMFISDNGAPTFRNMPETPIQQSGWNGSVNTPFAGEKETALEGGVRVPYIASWPGTIPQGIVYDEPVLQLDATATAVALAGGDISALDGKNLIPYLTGQAMGIPHEQTFHRLHAHESVREGDWKLMRASNNQFWLFDLSVSEPERINLAGHFPDVVNRLSQSLDDWSSTLQRPLPPVPFPAEIVNLNHHLPRPNTLVNPEIVIDLGYDQSTSSNELAIEQGSLQTLVFNGLRTGSGVVFDPRPGASRSNASVGGGGQSFAGWDLPNTGNALVNAIASDHYLEFDLTLDGSEVLSIEGIQLTAVAGHSATNFFTLFASPDGFATAPASGMQIGNQLLRLPYGDLNSPEFPVNTYLPFDFIPAQGLPIDEAGTTWTFRLYIAEDGMEDLNPVIIDALAFEVLERQSMDLNRDGLVDHADLALWESELGRSEPRGTGGFDFLEWQRQSTRSPETLPALQTVPEPSSLVLLVGLAIGILSKRASR